MEITFGEILFGGSVMRYQLSCRANSGNAGHIYTWTASVANSKDINKGDGSNSICAKGWQLIANIESNIKSFHYLIQTFHNIANSNDEGVRLPPLSFIRSGSVGGSGRGNNGGYWSFTTITSLSAYRLYFDSSGIKLHEDHYINKWNGSSLRCVKKKA